MASPAGLHHWNGGPGLLLFNEYLAAEIRILKDRARLGCSFLMLTGQPWLKLLIGWAAGHLRK